VPGIPSDYDAGINRGLGVPNGMNHFALRVLTLEDLETRRQNLEGHGVPTTPVIDLGAGKSVFFRDPNGIQLEYRCQMRTFDESDLHRESEGSIAMLG